MALNTTIDNSETYGSIVTDAGRQLILKAMACKKPIRLKYVVIGDGNGFSPTYLDFNTKSVIHPVYKRQIDALIRDTEDPNIINIDINIPPLVGGFWIREYGVYAEAISDENDFNDPNAPEVVVPTVKNDGSFEEHDHSVHDPIGTGSDGSETTEPVSPGGLPGSGEYGEPIQDAQPDSKDILFIYGSHAPVYKQFYQSGQRQTYVIRIPLIVSSLPKVVIDASKDGWVPRETFNQLLRTVQKMRRVNSKVWTNNSPIEAGGDLILPDGLTYRYGDKSLSVFKNGINLYPEYDYQEKQPERDVLDCDAITLTEGANPGDKFHVTVRPLGDPLPFDVSDNDLNESELINRVTHLENMLDAVSDNIPFVTLTKTNGDDDSEIIIG